MHTVSVKSVCAAALCMLPGLIATAEITAAGISPDRVTIVQADSNRRIVGCSLRVNKSLLARAKPAPRSFQLRELWRYSPDTKHWSDVSPKDRPPITILALTARTSGLQGQLLYELPHVIGLYFSRWTEDGRLHESTTFLGSVLCNDVYLKGPPPAGTHAACFPTAQGAAAGFIPNPPPPKH
jgi:hypothetical protein